MDGIDSFNLGVRFNSLLSTEACVGMDSMIQVKIEMECLQIMSIKSRCLYTYFKIFGSFCAGIVLYVSIYLSMSQFLFIFIIIYLPRGREDAVFFCMIATSALEEDDFSGVIFPVSSTKLWYG